MPKIDETSGSDTPALKVVATGSEPSAHRTRRVRSIISLGGCNLEYITRGFAGRAATKHIWRVTIPSLMSPPIILRRKYLENAEASDYLVRESEKPLLLNMLQSKEDLILIEPAADFITKHLLVGDSILPDFRCDIFGPGWGSISFDGIPELANATVLDPDDEIYWIRWRASFEQFYDQVAAPKLRDGTKIVVLARFLCEIHLADGQMKAFDNIETIKKRNRLLDNLYLELKKYDGLQFIEAPSEMQFSSSYAPYLGPWEFHPSEESYALWRRDLARILFGPAHAESTLRATLVENARTRSQVTAQLAAARSELESGTAEVARLGEEIAALQSTAVQQQSSWHDERTRLLSQIDDLTAACSFLECAAASRQVQLEASDAQLRASNALIHETSARLTETSRQLQEANAGREAAEERLRQTDQELGTANALLQTMQQGRPEPDDQARAAYEQPPPATAEVLQVETIAIDAVPVQAMPPHLDLLGAENGTPLESQSVAGPGTAPFDVPAAFLAPGIFAPPLSRHGFVVSPQLTDETDGRVLLRPALGRDAQGAAIFGPYKRLAPGRYSLTAFIAGTTPAGWRSRRGSVALDVFSPETDTVIASAAMPSRRIERLVPLRVQFDWPALFAGRPIEFRIHQLGNAAISVMGFELTAEPDL